MKLLKIFCLLLFSLFAFHNLNAQYNIQCNLENISSAHELSGVTFDPNLDRLYAISNGNNETDRFLHVFQLNGTPTPTELTSIDLISFPDAETICHISGNQFAIGDEDDGIYLVTINNSTTQIVANSNQLITINNIPAVDNEMYEGVVYSGSDQRLYFITQGGSNPGALYYITAPAAGDYAATQVTLPVANFCEDYGFSGLSILPNGNLLLTQTIESPSCDNLYELNISNNVASFVAGSIVTLPMNQVEGVAVVSVDEVWVVGEDNEMKLLFNQNQTPCDDDIICTIGSTYNSNCECTGGVVLDTDGDGVCDALDCAPNDATIYPFGPCEDGDICTVGEAYDVFCDCVGGQFEDSDSDGICDAEDSCPLTPGEVGDACDDGNECTIGETLDNNCACTGGIYQDMDDDGICDAQDSCPNVPGVIGSACDVDNNDCLTGGTLNSNCDCTGASYEDSDGDGVCDELDCFPNNPNVYPGGTCSDGNNCTEGETYNMYCQCVGGIFQDTDGDGICNGEDSCPNIHNNDWFDNTSDWASSFESGLNYWFQSINDDMNWLFKSGSTSTSGTGPSSAFDGSQYLYLEATGSSNSTGILQSEIVAHATTANYRTLYFYYHISGTANNMSLAFEVSSDCGDTWTELWSFCGLSDSWQQAAVDISSESDNFNSYRFVGQTGDSHIGDIAIDHITFNISEDPLDYCVEYDASFGDSCDDGDSNTVNETLDDSCCCVGVPCNTGNIPCDDGDPCTEGETYDSNCNCTGGTVIPNCGVAECETINFNDAESGFGIWNDGGSDASWYINNPTHTNSYAFSFMLRDDTESSVITTDALDLSNYSFLTIDFNFKSWSMELGEDFWLQISTDGGTTFTTVEEWARGTEFENHIWESEVVAIPGPFSSDTRIRFRCDASANNDYVFLDDILISACTGTADCVIGSACDDGDPCTENDMYDTDCNCTGEIIDTDGDGTCDLNDVCSNIDNNYLNQPCDDGNPCTINDIYTSDCGCEGFWQPSCDNPCTTFNFNDFSTTWGIWNDGGSDAIRAENSDFSFSDKFSLLIRDNTNTSVVTTDPLDLSNYGSITVGFTYITYSMDNATEDFWLQTSSDGGATFTTVEEWNRGDEFQNGIREFDQVTINGPFSNGELLRFRCDANGNGDLVFIDDILITACDEICPSIGNACDDGDDCTSNDVIDSDCNCAGTLADIDGDGFCDSQDCEPNDADIYPGAPCDDGDECTEGDTWIEADGPCYCIGTINENCGLDCTVISEDGFESGFENWYSGGSQCYLSTQYASTGTYSAVIADGLGTASSLISNPYDFSNSEIVSVSFSYYVFSMEPGETFWLEASTDGGATFTAIEDWVSGTDFNNFQYRYGYASIPSSYFTSSTIIRFRCDASSHSDRIHLDDIIVEDCVELCSAVDFNDVESGWGIWIDGGIRAERWNNANYAYSGTYSLRIRDNSNQSVITTAPLDLSAYESIKIDFTYITHSMDNSTEDFWLQIKDENGVFQTVEEWNRGDEFENNVREFDQVIINGPFGTAEEIRFRCDASGGADYVYLDDILISGCFSVSGNVISEVITESMINDSSPAAKEVENSNTMSKRAKVEADFVIYPNPTNRSSDLFIEGDALDKINRLFIYGIDGKKLEYQLVSSSSEKLQISTSNLEAGTYLIQIITDNGSFMKQVLLLD